MKITTKHKEVIELLSQGYTPEQVAKVKEVAQTTVEAWLKDDEFKSAIQEQQAKQINDLVPLAITSLRGVLEDNGASNSTRLQAVKQVLELSNLKNKVDTSGNLRIEIEYV